MNLFLSYKIAFALTVIFPFVTGIFLSIGGYYSLKDRAASDAQLNRIEMNTGQILKQLPEINGTLAVLNWYEASLAAVGSRDEALGAVLIQYRNMKRAAETWEQFQRAENVNDKYQLANEIIDILSATLVTATVRENLPGRPLILMLRRNTFRVLFAVPMRILPQLKFLDLPKDVQANVTEKSKFGFTVIFTPNEITITDFNFTADAEL